MSETHGGTESPSTSEGIEMTTKRTSTKLTQEILDQCRESMITDGVDVPQEGPAMFWYEGRLYVEGDGQELPDGWAEAK